MAVSNNLQQRDHWKCRDNSSGGPGWRWKPHKRHRGIIWPVLYAFVGTASWLVWREGGFDKQAWPLTLYAGLLFANLLAWPPVFVGSRDVPHACMDCIGELHMTHAMSSATDPAVWWLHIEAGS